MGRMKLGIAVAGAAIVLLGVVATVTMRSDGGTNRATTVANQASEPGTATAVTTVAPSAPASTPVTQPAPATKAPSQTSPAPKAPSAPATTVAGTNAPAAAVTPPSIPRSPQDVQQFIAGMTAQIQATAASNGNAPVTKEQIEAQIRAQLQQLGITF